MQDQSSNTPASKPVAVGTLAGNMLEWSRYSPVTLKPADRGKLHDHGYEPIPVRGKATYASGWTEGDIDPLRLKEWRLKHPDHVGTGLRTGAIKGVDLDVTDDAALRIIVTTMLAVIGSDPLCKRGSKGLTAFYCTAEPSPKIVLPFTGPDGMEHKIEVLGIGNQTACYGAVKPEDNNGKPEFAYRWLDGRSPLDTPVQELPMATADSISEFLTTVGARLTAAGYMVGDISRTRRRDKAERRPSAHEDTPVIIESALAWLKDRAGAVQGGNNGPKGVGGDRWTYETACWLMDQAVSEAMTLDLMLEHWNDKCDPAWSPDDLERKVRSAARTRQNGTATKLPLTELGDTEDSIMPKDMPGKSTAPAAESKKSNDYDPSGVPTKEEKLNSVRARIAAGDKDIATAISTTPLPEYFVDGMLAYGGMNMVLGDRGSGKTTVCMDIMLHIAHGMPWQGVQVDSDLVVIYFSLEDPEGAMLRVQAWYANQNGLDPEAQMSHSPRFRLYQKHVDAFDSDLDMRAFFFEYMKMKTDPFAALGKPRKVVIVMDTWQRFTSAAPSQSDEAFMNRAFDALEFSVKDFMRAFPGAKAGAVGVFHPSKSGPTAAGAWQLENRSVGILTVVQVRDKLKKPTGVRYVEDTRNKNGPEGSRIEFTIKGVALPGVNNFGKAPSGAVLVAKEAVKSAEVRKAEVERRTNSVASSVAYNVYRMMESLSLKPGTTVNMVATRIESDAKAIMHQRKVTKVGKAEMNKPVIPWKPVPGSSAVTASVEEWPTSRSNITTRIMQLAGAGPVHVVGTPFMMELVEAPQTGSMTVVYRQMDDNEKAVFGEGIPEGENS